MSKSDRLKELISSSNKPPIHQNNGEAVASSRAISAYFELPHDTLLYIYKTAQSNAESNQELTDFYAKNLKKPLFGNHYDLTRAAFRHFSEPPHYGGYQPEKRAAFTALYDNFAVQKTNINMSAVVIEPVLIKTRTMTLEEAQEKHAQLKSLQSVARALLLEIRNRRGYIVLGYESFEEYAEVEWGYSQSYVYRLSKAEEIQNSLNSPIGEKEIPETHLRHLSKVPEADRAALFAEVNAKAEAEGKERTAKMVQEAVANYQKTVSEQQQTIESLTTQLSQKSDNAKQIEELEAEVSKKEKELEDLVKEGGIDNLVSERAALSTAKINELTTEITFLQTERTAAIERGVELALAKKAQQVKALEDDITKKSSDLETLNSKISYQESVNTYNATHQRLATALLETLLKHSGELSIIDDSKKLILEPRTLKLLNEVAAKCTALGEQIKAKATFKQVEFDNALTDLFDDIKPETA